MQGIEAPLGPVSSWLAAPVRGRRFASSSAFDSLVENLRIDPESNRVFTFTNKAADEIASRTRGPRPARRDCEARNDSFLLCELLRELGAHVGLKPGFGIADQRTALSTRPA